MGGVIQVVAIKSDMRYTHRVMAVNVTVEKQQTESTANLVRRFTQRLQGAGVVQRMRTARYFKRAKSKNVARRSRLLRLARKSQYERLLRLGKVQRQGPRARRR